MKSTILSFVFIFSLAVINAQEDIPLLYDPSADAKTDIHNAVKHANNEGKHVLIQIGGNW